MAKEKVFTTKALRINTNLYQADEPVTEKDLAKLPAEQRKQLFDDGKLVTKEASSKDEDDGDDKVTKASLMSENKDDLTAKAEALGLPKDEWVELNKEPLADYLLEKLQEPKAEKE